ncbi:MAG: hypothetical protein S4CHLAM6_13010 [Chlamydiae bacterium]|nr:hypothetical protein [Chlamydiota bacterium]
MAKKEFDFTKFNPEVAKFFKHLTNDKALQDRLYRTAEVVDVANIAVELGFQITGCEILKAQAGRVLELPQSDLDLLTAGKQAKGGAQWGRFGKGYLERPGYWIIKIVDLNSKILSQNSKFNEQFKSFINEVHHNLELKSKLQKTQTFNEVAKLTKEHDCSFSAAELLKYQARRIRELKDEEAEAVSRGAGDQVD